jgi:hypothetical protein
MSADIKFNMADFNRQLSAVKNLIGRNGASYVRTTARRLIRRFAWNAPIAKGGYAARGRLRAGFWPAAQLLGISNIYTSQANKDEGSGQDQTRGNSPRFTITNAVPYIGNLKGGLSWAENALNGVRAQMVKDLMKYAESSWKRNELIDDLSAE